MKLEGQEQGLLMIGVADETYELIARCARKRQIRPAEAFSEALRKYAESTLTPEEYREVLGKLEGVNHGR